MSHPPQDPESPWIHTPPPAKQGPEGLPGRPGGETETRLVRFSEVLRFQTHVNRLSFLIRERDALQPVLLPVSLTSCQGPALQRLGRTKRPDITPSLPCRGHCDTEGRICILVSPMELPPLGFLHALDSRKGRRISRSTPGPVLQLLGLKNED